VQRTVWIAIGVLALGATIVAQTAVRRATNLAALISYPGYFHLRPILVDGALTLRDDGEWWLKSDGLSMRVLVKGSAPEGDVEVTGEFWDVGRMGPDDPRLTAIDVQQTFHLDPNAPWPSGGKVLAIEASRIETAAPPPAPTIRSVVLFPARYVDQAVTLTGQFSGRNLLGDLPDAPGRGRWDFVLRSADAAVWVSGAQPKGHDFDLSLDRRLDTDRWLTVTGVLHEGHGLQWIEAKAGNVSLGTPPAAVPTRDELPVHLPPPPPPEVIFSAPMQGETDVALDTTVRIQFSRDIDPKTVKGHISATYVEAPGGAAGQTAVVPAFTTAYRPANRVLEVTFATPLERFQTLALSLEAGIKGTDGQPLKPWRVTFDLGG
jgi:Bacterial Ig-like domain